MDDHSQQILRSLYWLKGFILGMIVGIFFVFLAWPVGAHADTVGYIDAAHDEASFLTVFGNIANNIASGNSFVLAADCTISGASIYYQRTGARVALDPTLEIQTNNAGVPSNTILETGTTLTDTATSYDWATSTFSGTVTLTSGTTYWLVGRATQEANSYLWAQNANAGSQQRTTDNVNWSGGGNPAKNAAMAIYCTSGGGGGGSSVASSTSTAIERSETIASLTFAIVLAMLVYFFIKLFTPKRNKRL